MIEIFVSSLCPDCIEVIENYKKDPLYYGKAVLIDITESMANLKRFLSYRDNKIEFKEKIQTNQVGIPVIISDKEEVKFI